MDTTSNVPNMGSADEREVSPATHNFEVVRHGFNREQVQRYVATLEANLRLSNAERDSAQSQVSTLTSQLNESFTEVKGLRQRVDELSKPARESEDIHDRLRVPVQVTKAEAAEITSRAQQAAEQTWGS